MTAADVERRLFEVLGGWAPEAPEPEAKLLLRIDSFRHARHAEGVEGADLQGVDGVDDLAAMIEDAAAGPADTRSRLSAVYRGVVPALVAAYTKAIGDALDAIVAEDEEAMQEAERLLAKLEVEFAPAKGRENT